LSRRLGVESSKWRAHHQKDGTREDVNSVFRLRGTPAALIEIVNAPDEKAAIAKAIEEYNITDSRAAKAPCRSASSVGFRGSACLPMMKSKKSGERPRAAAAPYGSIIRLLILRGQRRGEVAGMTWSEISQDLATWTITTLADFDGNGIPKSLFL
jgi:hypothetical protein